MQQRFDNGNRPAVLDTSLFLFLAYLCNTLVKRVNGTFLGGSDSSLGISQNENDVF